MTALTHFEPVAPSAEESDIARDSSRTLARFVSKNLTVRIDETGETVELPESAVRLLVDLLATMAEGNAVTLIPIHAELTTQQAADILGVSRPYLIKLLENKEIPFHKVGTHRRVFFKALMDYKAKANSQRETALDALVQQAQELKMGY